MKYLVACVCSAIIGGLTVVAMTERHPASETAAQDAGRGPAFPGATKIQPTAPAAPKRPTTLAPLPVAESHAEEDLTPEEKVNVAVYDTVNKSVVHLTTKGVRADVVFLFDVTTEGTGSGSVLDKSGHILTNYHVIEGSQQVSVTLYDGKSYDAKFIGADPVNDVAVIKVDAPPESLFPVALGDSRKLRVGMRVFAIGNPFGLERTLTTGIISSLNRSLQIHSNRTIKSIIQIDAAINPGNSGGPLLDTHARLIGINTAIASKTGQSAGVGFAIPVNLISRIVPQLIATGHVVRPEVGISRVYETEKGLLVARVTPGGPAERAGLQGPAMQSKRRGPFVIESVDRSAADLIIAVDGEKVSTADDFLGHIESKNPGEIVSLTVVRNGKEVRVPVQLVSSTDLQAPPSPGRSR